MRLKINLSRIYMGITLLAAITMFYPGSSCAATGKSIWDSIVSLFMGEKVTPSSPATLGKTVAPSLIPAPTPTPIGTRLKYEVSSAGGQDYRVQRLFNPGDGECTPVTFSIINPTPPSMRGNGLILSLLEERWPPAGYTYGYTGPREPIYSPVKVINNYIGFTSLGQGGSWSILQWANLGNGPEAIFCPVTKPWPPPPDPAGCVQLPNSEWRSCYILCYDLEHHCYNNCEGDLCFKNAQNSYLFAQKSVNGQPCVELAFDNNNSWSVCDRPGCQSQVYNLYIDPFCGHSCEGANVIRPSLSLADMVSLTPEMRMRLNYLNIGGDCDPPSGCDPSAKYANVGFGMFFNHCTRGKWFYYGVDFYATRGLPETCGYTINPDGHPGAWCPPKQYGYTDPLVPGGSVKFYAPNILPEVKNTIIENDLFGFTDPNIPGDREVITNPANWYAEDLYIGWESMGRISGSLYLADIDLKCQLTDGNTWGDRDDDKDCMTNRWEVENGHNPFNPSDPGWYCPCK